MTVNFPTRPGPSPTLFHLPQWSLRGSSCWERLSCNRSVPVSAVLDAELGELVNREVKFKHPALGSHKTYVTFTDIIHIKFAKFWSRNFYSTLDTLSLSFSPPPNNTQSSCKTQAPIRNGHVLVIDRPLREKSRETGTMFPANRKLTI